MLIVRFFRCEVYTTPKAAGSEKLRHELYVCEVNSGDQEMHGQKRNIHRKPFRNLNRNSNRILAEHHCFFTDCSYSNREMDCTLNYS